LEPALVYAFAMFLIDVRGCLNSFQLIDGFLELHMLWVGLGYGEEAILLVLFYKLYKTNLKVFIHGIDVDPDVVKYTLKTIEKYSLSDAISYETLSIMEVNIAYIKKYNIKCLYTSAAFDTMTSLYLFYLCAAADIFMFCNMYIVKNIVDLQSQISETLNIPSAARANKNLVWYIAARGSLYTINNEFEKRNIIIFNVDTITTTNTLRIVQRYATAVYNRAKDSLRYGKWCER
jgi:hypothetical protein